MNFPLLLPFVSFSVLLGLAVLLRRLGVPENRFVIVSFFVFGFFLGQASAFLWPRDLGVYLNVFGTAAGDGVYRTAISWIGNPNSDQAHFTIPWFFRIPQVYAWVSPLLYGAIGWIFQSVCSRIRREKPQSG